MRPTRVHPVHGQAADSASASLETKAEASERGDRPSDPTDQGVAGLKLHPVSCTICGHVDTDPIAVGEDFEYRTSPDSFLAVRCRRCCTVYLDPRPAESELDRIYPVSYHAFDFSAERFGLAYRVRRRLEARRLLSWCADLGEEARILDVGCGDGFHLGLLRQYGRPGWRMEGVDASLRAVLAARQAGLTVHHGRVEDVDLVAGSYDRIFLIATLEHVADPTRLLSRVAELLDSHGRIVVVTDSTATLDFRIFRRRHWGGYHFPRHWNLFDPSSLRALAQKTGLAIEQLTTQVSPVNWTYSVRNMLDDWGAPRWLVDRFTLRSPVALAAFTLLDMTQKLVGRAALLRAVLYLPRGSEGHQADRSVRQRLESERPRRSNGGPPVAILGAGIAGLVTARELTRRGIPVRVFERGRQIAGLARSFRDEDGFTYDFGAHFITNRLAAAIGAGDLCRVVRRYGESVLLNGGSIAYPLGFLGSPRYVASALHARIAGNPLPVSAAGWFRTNYGRALADDIAIPIVEKWSGQSAEDLSAAVGQKFSSTIRTILVGPARRMTRRAIASGYCHEQFESVHVYHVHPEGGVAALCERVAAGLEDAVRLESTVDAIFVDGQRAVGVRVNGEMLEAAAVVSTAPIQILPKLIDGSEALEPFRRFRFRPIIVVQLQLEGRGLLPDVVLWTPGDAYPFFRVTEAPVSIPWLAPPGKTLLTIDLACELGDAVWTRDDDVLGEQCLDALRAVIPDVRTRALGIRVLRTPIGYPVYLREYEEDRQSLQQTTGVGGLFSVGRNGKFSHDLMEDVYWRTVTDARRVRAYLDASRS